MQCGTYLDLYESKCKKKIALKEAQHQLEWHIFLDNVFLFQYSGVIKLILVSLLELQSISVLLSHVKEVGLINIEHNFC